MAKIFLRKEPAKKNECISIHGERCHFYGLPCSEYKITECCVSENIIFKQVRSEDVPQIIREKTKGILAKFPEWNIKIEGEV